ncbi:MAG: hypothetical protein KDB03_13305 [Planctomycetales bacterium]|nr:hypothetical protein [Planctomycetales bacterium]
MARAYSGVLGSIALSLVICRGIFTSSFPEQILSQGLWIFFGFSVIGYCIGFLADQTVCESVENRFRTEMGRLRTKAEKQESETAS